jgi:thiol-disulfide isomerase/thioredoxin
MLTARRVMVWTFVVTLLATLGLFLPLLHGEEPIAPDQQKKAEGETTVDGKKKDAAPPVEVTDAARPLVDKVRDAYARLPGLQTSGTWKAEWDIEGKPDKRSAEFASSFGAPNKFRYEVKDDVLFGSTGEKLFVLMKNQYLTLDAPKARVAADELPKTFGDFLKEKDPSLLLAATATTTDGGTPYLADRATKIDKGDDVKLGDAAFTALKVSTESEQDVVVLIDPATNLMRRWSVDVKRSLEKRGRQDVKYATMTIDYATVKPEAPKEDDAFAWAPPAGAKDAARMAAAQAAEPSELQGKPAPAFELEDLDGKKVKLAELKGSVVVLDFWATWCPPCRKGLPILDGVAEARKDKGLKVFAVNLEEERDAVAKFAKESKLSVRVLLDASGDTGRTYGASSIPLTVIIGKDGVVRKAMVGLHPQDELEKAIDEVLKG